MGSQKSFAPEVHAVQRQDGIITKGWAIPKPIGPTGTWQFSYYPGAPWWAWPIAWYWAWSGSVGEDGWYRHWRLGARYDDVDSYCQWPTFATRRFPQEGERDTSAG